MDVHDYLKRTGAGQRPKAVSISGLHWRGPEGFEEGATGAFFAVRREMRIAATRRGWVVDVSLREPNRASGSCQRWVGRCLHTQRRWPAVRRRIRPTGDI